MGRIACVLMILFIGSALRVEGQVTAFSSGLTFRKMLFDYQSQNGGNIASFKDYRHGYEMAYNRTLTKQIMVALPVRYGVIDFPNEDARFLSKRLLSLDVQFQYHFNQPPRKVTPYVFAGLGGAYEWKESTNVQVPAGLGVNIRLTDRAFVNIQSEYRYAFGENRNNLQHGIGFVYMIGKESDSSLFYKKDTDGDGIADEKDLCPELKGIREFAGCPDTDEDSVPDYLDKCVEIKGLKEFDGCPDSDNDGVPDNIDECPKIAGVKSNKGCPESEKKQQELIEDTDGDGVPDSRDKCPGEKGSFEAAGCPDQDLDGVPDDADKCPDAPGLRIYYGCPDTDSDGIDDGRDKCPKVAGTVANEGCPEIRKEDKKTLELAMQAVKFKSGSAILETESNIVLSEIGRIMTRYPDFNMAISGHTDDDGSETANQTLSEQRAKACYDYLIKKGVDAKRMSFQGFGESKPITSNTTKEGKSINRRVEFNLIVRQ
jgi:OOP family OmpA-OmpF porin